MKRCRGRHEGPMEVMRCTDCAREFYEHAERIARLPVLRKEAA